MFKNRKIVSAKFRVIFVLLYIIIITLFDVYSYGIIYQQKIKQEHYNNPVWSWVFMESKSEQEGVNEHITVPHYRIIQKSLEILGILIIFYFCSVWSSLGLLFSHYLLTYDLFFYLFLNQTYLFREFQNQYSPYWLQNCYQAGYFLLQPFNPMLFYISGITGIMVAVVLSLIKIER